MIIKAIELKPNKDLIVYCEDYNPGVDPIDLSYYAELLGIKIKIEGYNIQFKNINEFKGFRNDKAIDV
jgi:hypothetical protein